MAALDLIHITDPKREPGQAELCVKVLAVGENMVPLNVTSTNNSKITPTNNSLVSFLQHHMQVFEIYHESMFHNAMGGNIISLQK